ncbi:MAG: gfo/Idh/MocA family oxidoreductase [Calditrichaeota bacterium]|nr:MAG: gfo/Idh/MocA family oxidoreductase [Calditrichota bacterium]
MKRNRLNFGIIGCGKIAVKRYIPVMVAHPDCVRLVAIQRRNKEKLEEIQQQWNIPRAYERVEDLLKDPEVEAVVIASPPGLHKHHTLQAAQMKQIIIVEKPMAGSFSDAQEMIEICSIKNVHLWIAYSFRFCKAIQQAIQLINKGMIGQIYHLQGVFTVPVSPKDRSWLEKPELAGGGSIIDLGSHIIDIFRQIVTSSVEKVQKILRPEFSTSQIEKEGLVQMLFSNGVTAQLFTSFSLPRHKSLTIYGSEGKIYVENFSEINQEVVIFLTSDNKTERIRIQNRNHFEDMLLTIVSGMESHLLCDGKDGLETQRIIDWIYS